MSDAIMCRTARENTRGTRSPTTKVKLRWGGEGDFMYANYLWGGAHPIGTLWWKNSSRDCLRTLRWSRSAI